MNHQTAREELRYAIAIVATAREKLSQAEKSLERGTAYVENARAACRRHAELPNRLAQHYAAAIDSSASVELPEDLLTAKRESHEATTDLGLAEAALLCLEGKVTAARGMLAEAEAARDRAASIVFYDELTPIAERLTALNAERRHLRSLLDCAMKLPIGRPTLATVARPSEILTVVGKANIALNDPEPLPQFYPERPDPSVALLRSFFEALRIDPHARLEASEDYFPPAEAKLRVIPAVA